MELLIKKRVSGKFSKMGASAKGQFGLGFGHKIQSRNPMRYFIMIKKIVDFVLIVDYGRKWCHFNFKGISWPEANN